MDVWATINMRKKRCKGEFCGLERNKKIVRKELADWMKKTSILGSR